VAVAVVVVVVLVVLVLVIVEMVAVVPYQIWTLYTVTIVSSQKLRPRAFTMNFLKM
jgi:hypothetical protein